MHPFLHYISLISPSFTYFGNPNDISSLVEVAYSINMTIGKTEGYGHPQNMGISKDNSYKSGRKWVMFLAEQIKKNV